MRETIAYSQNNITGDRNEYKKYKPDDAPMRGVTTLQLLDLEGKVVQEVKSENIINNYNKKLAYMHYFYQRIKGGTNGNHYSSPFSNLYLTTGTDAENAEDYYIKGNLIGWASKGSAYSGSSTTQGTINLKETNLDGKDENGNSVLHFVFDFPTHCANGTFQSIYWANSTLAHWNITDTKFQCLDGGVAIPGKKSTTGWVYSNGNVAVVRCETQNASSSIRYPGKVYYYNQKGELLRKMDTGGDDTFLGFGPGVNEMGQNLCVNANFYSGTGMRISVVNLDTGEQKYLTTNFAHGGSQVGCVAIIGDDLYLFAQDRYIYCKIRGSSVERVSNHNFKMNMQHMSIINNKLHVVNSDTNYAHLVDGATNTKMYPVGSTSYQALTNAQGVFFDGNLLRTYEVKQEENGDVYFRVGVAMTSQGVGAHNLLPESVTKTAVNTMKIQYDFIIETVPTYQ